MNRGMVLGVLVAAGGVTAAVAAYQAPQNGRPGPALSKYAKLVSSASEGAITR